MRAALLSLVVLIACDRSTERAPSAEPAPVAVPAAAMVPPVIDAGPPAGEVLVFTPAPIVPGQSWTVTFDAELDFDLNFGGHGQSTTTRQSKVKKLTALAADGARLTRARVTYTKRKTDMVIDGDPQTDKPAIRGKTYLVTWRDGAIDVETAAGKPPPRAELDEVRKEENPFQTFDAMARAMTSVPLIEGQPVEIPDAALAGFGDKTLGPERVVVTYLGMEGDLAVLAIAAVLTNHDEGLKLHLDLDGTVKFDRTGWLRSAVVTGQIRAELNGAEVGGGVGTGTITVTPRR